MSEIEPAPKLHFQTPSTTANILHKNMHNILSLAPQSTRSEDTSDKINEINELYPHRSDVSMDKQISRAMTPPEMTSARQVTPSYGKQLTTESKSSSSAKTLSSLSQKT
eukprot:263747_1